MGGAEMKINKLELEIQKRARNKDSKLILSEFFPEKIVFIRMQDGFKVCRVDAEWIRNNLNAMFLHGGHGFVYEFIPLNEIWVATHHSKNCICKYVRPDRKMSESYFNTTVIHEICEFQKMALGMPFKKAHKEALKKEIAEGYPDPYSEV